MQKLIIFLMVAGTIFISRRYITGFVLNFFKKRKIDKIDDITVEKIDIFAPRGTVRTFFIALNIEEQGNGKIDISIAKMKASDIIDK